MQERTWNFSRIVAVANGDSDFRWMIMRKLAREPAQNARFELPLTVSIVSPDAV
jgi:hypothetical protein